MRRFFSVFIGLTLISGLYAQRGSDLKSLKGVVTAESGDLESITIQNLTQKFATVTDKQGRFSIDVALGDTLLISALSFRAKKLVIDQTFIGVSEVSIPLQERVNELEGVTLRPFGLTGSIVADLDSLSPQPVTDAQSLGLPNAGIYIPTKNERMLYEATSGGGFIPLNPLLNALTGRTKDLKNRIRLDRKNKQLELIIERYKGWLFQDHLGIELAAVNRFLFFCEADQLYISTLETKDEFAFYEFLKRKANEFKSLE